MATLEDGHDALAGLVLTGAAVPDGTPVSATSLHLTRIETCVLLEAARAAKGVVELDHLDGPEEPKFTAARRLASCGLLTPLGPSTYQITRKGRDPKLLAGVALQWIRRKA